MHAACSRSSRGQDRQLPAGEARPLRPHSSSSLGFRSWLLPGSSSPSCGVRGRSGAGWAQRVWGPPDSAGAAAVLEKAA